MIGEEQQSCDKELIVRTNEEIRKQHILKLASLVSQEYKFKKLSAVLHNLEREISLSKESDLLFASTEIRNFPIVEEYFIKQLQINIFCYHLVEEMKYQFRPLGEELFSNQYNDYINYNARAIETIVQEQSYLKYLKAYKLFIQQNKLIELAEEEICFILKGKVSLYEERSAQEIEDDLLQQLKQHYNDIMKEITDTNLKKKFKKFIEKYKIIPLKSESSAIFRQESSNLVEEQQQSYLQDNPSQSIINNSQLSQTHIRSKVKRKTKKLKSIHTKQLKRVDEVEQPQSYSLYFTKEEINILQPIIKDILIRTLFRLIDKESVEESESSISAQQNKLLLWYQTKVDFFFNQFGVPKFTQVKSYYSGDHFKSKIGGEESEQKKQYIFAGDDLHILTVKRSKYDQINNYSDEQVSEKLKVFHDQFKDISKNIMAKFIYYFKKKEFTRKDHLWKERDTCNGIFFIAYGEIEYIKSYKMRLKTAKNTQAVQREEIELVKKNEQVTKLLNICTFHQGCFIGVEDLFDYSQKRIYSAVVKSDVVQVYHLQMKDLENIKKHVPDILTQLTQKAEQKKKILVQKLAKVIQNVDAQGRNKDSLTEMLEDSPQISKRRYTNQLDTMNSYPVNQETMERQKQIESKEKKKFTNTNDIKEIDRLFRKEFGKKKYLQMIQNNPMVILSDSTLNSLESVMNLSDEQINTDRKTEEIKSKVSKNIQNPQAKNSISTLSVQKREQLLKKEESQSLEQQFELQINKKDSHKDFRSIKASIKNVMQANSVLKQFAQAKKKNESFQNLLFDSNLSPKYQLTQNDSYVQLGSGNKLNLEQPQLIASYSQQTKLKKPQPQNSQSPIQIQSSDVYQDKFKLLAKQKVRGKIVSKKEKQQQRQQKLLEELNVMRSQGLKSYLSDQQLQHLAENKVKRQEDLKDINKLNIFEQQKLKQSLLKKPIRPGQKDMLTDEQKQEMKVQLSNLIEEKNEQNDHDFIFKSVSTPQSIKQLQFKINQKLKNKPGFQNSNDSTVEDKPWRQDSMKRASFQNQGNIIDSNRRHNSIISVQSNSTGQVNVITSLCSTPKSSRIDLSQIQSKSIPQTSYQLKNSQNSNHTKQENDSIIESEQAIFSNYYEIQNRMIQTIDAIDSKNQVLKPSEEGKQNENSSKNDVAQQRFSDLTSQPRNIHKRAQSANPKQDIYRVQSPIIKSRNYNPKFQNQTQSPLLSFNKKKQNGSQTQQIPDQKSRITCLVSKIEDLRKSLEHIKSLNKSIQTQSNIPFQQLLLNPYFNTDKNLSQKQQSDLLRNQLSDVSRNQQTDLSRNQQTDLTINQQADSSNNQPADLTRKSRYSIINCSPKSFSQHPSLENSLFKQQHQTDSSNTKTGYQFDLKNIQKQNNANYNIFQQFPMTNFCLDQPSLSLQDKKQLYNSQKQLYKSQQNSISNYSTALAWYCQTHSEQSPLTIKSLNLQDFSSFDRIRLQSASISSNSEAMKSNKISNMFMSPDFNGTQHFSNSIRSFKNKNDIFYSTQTSPQQQFLSRKLNEAYAQPHRKFSETSVQSNSHQSQLQELISKTNNQSPNNEHQNNNSALFRDQSENITTNNQNATSKQNILPLQRIHSAKGGIRKYTKEQVIHQINNQYQKSKGLLVVSTTLLKHEVANLKSAK